MYDGKEKKAYVYCLKNNCKFETFSKWINNLKSQRLFKGHRSVLATIFLKLNPTHQSIASILCETNHEPYWKTTLLINAQDILLNIKEKILPRKEFSGTAIQEINEGLEFKFAIKDGQPEKKLIIFFKNGLHSYEICILNKIVQDIYLLFSIKAMERTIDDIINIIRYVFSVKVCCEQSTVGFEDVIQIRGTQLVRNEKDHTPFAFMKKNGQIYRRVDLNSTKTIYVSKKILIEKVNQQRLVIKEQKEIIINLKERLNQKIKNEEEEISIEMANITHFEKDCYGTNVKIVIINNITVHNLNTLIFELAAKLEYIKIHTLGLLCDGVEKNRSHIKSFDWYASKWTLGDIVEVNFNKDKKSFHVAKILSNNFEKTKFIIIPLDNNNSEPINIERIFIHPPMSPKLEWKINDMCKFKNPNDNQWYLGKIIN
ncbi:hypothetical protein Glove_437g23 [Diversispora epigaea]|uniref:Tudor domain-containing protein n=1 Tax=Diversispora epigaea TaxID=1348612 RepID=A0A397H0A6_9GLOM|nr:hypothetical protein Glove_437g23 [Diversispora epigaea]